MKVLVEVTYYYPYKDTDETPTIPSTRHETVLEFDDALVDATRANELATIYIARQGIIMGAVWQKGSWKAI